MLNLLPNIAPKPDITETISKRYIPLNVRPQRRTYQYNQIKISHMHKNDRQARQNSRSSGSNSKQMRPYHSNYNLNSNPGTTAGSSRSNLYPNPQVRPLLHNPPWPYYPMGHYSMPVPRLSFACTYHRVPFSYNSNTCALQNRMTLMQNNMYQNMLAVFENHGNTVQQTGSLTMMNSFATPNIRLFQMRHSFVENQCRQPFYQNFIWQQRFWQRHSENTSTMQSNTHSHAIRRYGNTRRNAINETVNRPSFTTRPGATSWADLKKKWCEEKMPITIDEDNKNLNESGEEVQVVESGKQVVESEGEVQQLINPLVGSRYASSLAEVYSKLAIIKSAPEKSVRRKKSRYKISYNVYSCSQHYRKANPGQPLYSVVVIRYNLLITCFRTSGSSPWSSELMTLTEERKYMIKIFTKYFEIKRYSYKILFATYCSIFVKWSECLLFALMINKLLINVTHANYLFFNYIVL